MKREKERTSLIKKSKKNKVKIKKKNVNIVVNESKTRRATFKKNHSISKSSSRYLYFGATPGGKSRYRLSQSISKLCLIPCQY